MCSEGTPNIEPAFHFCCPATNESHMPVMNFPDMFPALSSFWFGRGDTGPCSSFSAPSDPFQKIFLHIHRVIVIVDLITKICRLSNVQNNVYVLRAPFLFSNSSSTADSRSYCQKKKILESAALEELEKGRELTVLFCTFDKMSFNLQGPGKHRFGSANDAVPGNHLPCRNYTYRYVDTRRIPLENNPDDRYCTRYLSRGKQSKQNPKKM